MNTNRIVTVLAALMLAAACDKRNDDLVMPLKDFPQVITFDDEGDGDLEDEDHFSFVLATEDNVKQDVSVRFEIKEISGFDRIADYIKSCRAFYEIDDCTESDNLPVQFDPATGKGTVQFPAGVSEVEVEFEVDDNFFDDDVVNDGDRSLLFMLTGIDAGSANVVINPAAEFRYDVLDDEAVYGDWELDHENAEQFTKFKSLFSIVSEDIAVLKAEDVSKIEISFEYGEIKVLVELKETEMVTECGETEEVNKTIEIETEIEELNGEGDIETIGELEQENGTVEEFSLKGRYDMNGDSMELQLKAEYDDNETEEITLLLAR